MLNIKFKERQYTRTIHYILLFRKKFELLINWLNINSSGLYTLVDTEHLLTE
jgi:hypothetical protein